MWHLDYSVDSGSEQGLSQVITEQVAGGVKRVDMSGATRHGFTRMLDSSGPDAPAVRVRAGWRPT